MKISILYWLIYWKRLVVLSRPPSLPLQTGLRPLSWKLLFYCDRPLVCRRNFAALKDVKAGWNLHNHRVLLPADVTFVVSVPIVIGRQGGGNGVTSRDGVHQQYCFVGKQREFFLYLTFHTVVVRPDTDVTARRHFRTARQVSTTGLVRDYC